MSLFTELMDEVLEQDPNLSLECFLSARRYIQIRWRALHGTPMPEDALIYEDETVKIYGFASDETMRQACGFAAFP